MDFDCWGLICLSRNRALDATRLRKKLCQGVKNFNLHLKNLEYKILYGLRCQSC